MSDISTNIDLSLKSNQSPNICAIEIDASGDSLPAQNGSLQPFSNTFITSETSKYIYFGKGSVSFVQEGKQTPSGFRFEQILMMKFPNGDLLTSSRIQQYQKVKFIYVRLTNGVIKLMGRNDYFQNTSPKVEIKNTEKLAQVTYKTVSIFPIGDTNDSGQNLLPGDFPLNFYTL